MRAVLWRCSAGIAGARCRFCHLEDEGASSAAREVVGASTSEEREMLGSVALVEDERRASEAREERLVGLPVLPRMRRVCRYHGVVFL